MKTGCFVPSCRNNRKIRNRRLSFHPFPTNEEEKKRWIQCIGSSAQPNSRSVVCSEHFVPSDILRLSSKKVLKSNAFPQLNLGDQPAPVLLEQNYEIPTVWLPCAPQDYSKNKRKKIRKVVPGRKKLKMMERARDDILLLFDVDGTLTHPRSMVEPEFEEFLYTKVKPLANIAIVGGSDLNKMVEQLNGEKIIKEFDFVFSENGLVYFEKGDEGGKRSIQQHLGEETLQRFINFTMKYMSELKLPFKRGTFIEFRSGMLNIAPVGRQCSREERNFFETYDKKHQIRANMIKVLKSEFEDVDLTYSIGGQISFDVFPHGWDKTYCLQHVEEYNFKEVHFFGDKTDPGGNDHEIYNDPRVVGHKVRTPTDTQKILMEMFNL